MVRKVSVLLLKPYPQDQHRPQADTSVPASDSTITAYDFKLASLIDTVWFVFRLDCRSASGKCMSSRLTFRQGLQVRPPRAPSCLLHARCHLLESVVSFSGRLSSLRGAAGAGKFLG